MKLRSKILIILLFVGIFWTFNNVSFAGEQSLNSLNYQVQLNSDGSMDVVETWDIYIKSTNTLFKDFELDSTKYSGITNVKVKNLTTGKRLTQTNEEWYYVTKDCYYALQIDDYEFEIAWGVGLDDSSATRKYEISYTVEDAVTVYNDCSELYWKFVDTSNSIPAKKVTGTIKLPQSVKSTDNLRVWAHGPLNGEIKKTSNNTVTFSVNKFSSKTMLETRIVTEEQIFTKATKKVSENKLDSILKEEKTWADEANRTRMYIKIAYTAVYIIMGILILVLVFKIKKYFEELKKIKKEQYNEVVLKYFRDIPRENDATPAEAAFLYYSKGNKFDMISNISKVFSATLLQLCLKGFISFEEEDKENIKINFVEDVSTDKKKKLKISEKIIYDFLREMADDKPYITLQKIQKIAKEDYDLFHSIMSKLEKRGKKANIEIENYDEEKDGKIANIESRFLFYVSAICYSLPITCIVINYSIMIIPQIVITIEMCICGLILFLMGRGVNLLTEKGVLERQQWRGLEKYMEEFSMLDKREIPELVLWEKYLVYATAFGVADKVIKQLKVVYPEMNNLDRSYDSYMHLLLDPGFERGFIQDLNTGIDKAYNSYVSAYNTAHSSSSSGSGGGGGFSSGGGGRRWRWPEWEADRR